MLPCSFLIESSLKLLVTKTGIKARSSSILGPIRPLILELLALEWRKFLTFELEYLWSQLANLDQILCVASLGWGKGCIRFGDRLDHQVSDLCPFGYLFVISYECRLSHLIICYILWVQTKSLQTMYEEKWNKNKVKKKKYFISINKHFTSVNISIRYGIWKRVYLELSFPV